MIDDYGMSWAQAQYDRQEGPDPFEHEEPLEPPAEDE